MPELPSASLQERLWNQAYDKLKAEESAIVDAYEKYLSAQLQEDGRSHAITTENKIEPAERRWHQMERLIYVGLQRTEKDAAAKQKIGDILQTVNIVKGMVETAVQAAPEAAVAWVGVCFALEVLSNPFTEPGINREGLAYVVSRMDWYWNLVCLLLDERPTPAFAGLREQLENHVVQLYQKLLLYQMKSVCTYHRKRVAVFFRDMVVLDDWKGQLAEIKDAEAAVRSDSKQYNSHKARVRLEDLATTAELQYAELKGITSAILHQTRRQDQIHEDEKNKECLDDLYETDPRHDKMRIQNTKGGLLRDAYSWILESPDFKRWRIDPEAGLFWVKGDPGKGKTMLLCGIIDELEKDPANQLSYFFCQATEQKLNNATAVLRGLVYMLVHRYRPLISHVRQEYDGGGRQQRFEGLNAWEVMSKILTAMLVDPTLDGVVLVVDALDECSAGRPQLLDFLIRLSASSRAKWIVSSRNWPDIEEKLGAATQKVTLHLELNEDSISNAVRAYIQYKVGELAQLKVYDNATRDVVHQHFTDKSNNTFLWVALAYQELVAPDVQSWEAVDILEALPSGLESLYGRMMEHIRRSRHAELCRQILAAASVAYRPILLKELASIVESLARFADNLVALKTLIGSCGSFLTLREGVLYFVHQSAKDFLISKASAEILPHGIEHQHRAIFSRSVDVLSRTLRRDMYQLVAPGFSIDDVPQLDPDPLAPARYSCVHWVDHLQDADPAEKLTLENLQDGGLVHTFLQRKYLYWLEAMSLQRCMSQAVLAIRKLDTMVIAAGTQQLADFVRDARRFVLSQKGGAENYPLQLYASALVFAPTRSLVRNLFKHEEPSWIMSPPVMELDWNACVHTLEGHGDSVDSVAFSADGQRLTSGSTDKTVKVWDVATGACVQTLKGHSNWVTSVAFSADSQWLASGSIDKTVKVWDVATGTCVQTLKGHSNWVNSVAFSADSKQLASGSDDKTVKVWNTATGVCVQRLRGHSKWVTSVTFSANSQRLASGSHDRTVKIWDAATSACLQTFEGHSDWVMSVSFSVDSQLLASGSYDTTVKLWNVVTGQCVRTIEGHSRWVTSVAFSADGQWLASGSDDKTFKVWDVATGACVQTVKSHSRPVTSVAFSADDRQLASGSCDRTIKVWDIATDACIQTVDGHGGQVNSVAISADSQWLASVSDDKTIKVWDAATYACLQTIKGHSGPVTSVAFSADRQWLASGSADNTIKVWDAATYACLQTIKGHNGPVTSVAFSADRQWLASGSDDNTIKVSDAATGACVQTLEGHSGWVMSVAFSADGQRLASGSYDKTVKLWDASTGACVQTLRVGRRVTHLTFDLKTNTRLSTNIGALALDSSPVDTLPLKISTEEPQYYGYRICPDNVWILKNMESLLWLPSEYRPSASAITGSTIVLGCPSGRVLVIVFDE